MAFLLFCMPYFPQDDHLQVHPHCCEWTSHSLSRRKGLAKSPTSDPRVPIPGLLGSAEQKIHPPNPGLQWESPGAD